MRTVLIADDNLVSLKILQVILEKNGYQVITACDGAQAWDLLCRNTEVRLAILDWMMPGLSGVEICQRLQRERHSAMVYAILLTATDGKENVIYGLQQGASDYIIKPFEKAELLARLSVGERILDLQSRLAQSQKLESIGQLAAGIAHEINTPAQYVSDNIMFLQEGFGDLQKLLNKYKKIIGIIRPAAAMRNLMTELDALAQEIDEPYLLDEIPRAIEQSSQGIGHIAHIVQAMKQFAHPGDSEKEPIDINQAIENSIVVTRNSWKYHADLETDFDPDLPMIGCLPGEFNQVILNVIVNAADAIAEVLGRDTDKKGVIRIVTRQDESNVEIRISDTGTGIPESIRDKVFDPFFTTKSVGKGTGQGLAITYSIIVDKHGGTIDFETESGQGTTFIIRLPIEPADVNVDNLQELTHEQ